MHCDCLYCCPTVIYCCMSDPLVTAFLLLSKFEGSLLPQMSTKQDAINDLRANSGSCHLSVSKSRPQSTALAPNVVFHHILKESKPGPRTRASAEACLDPTICLLGSGTCSPARGSFWDERGAAKEVATTVGILVGRRNATHNDEPTLGDGRVKFTKKKKTGTEEMSPPAC